VDSTWNNERKKAWKKKISSKREREKLVSHITEASVGDEQIKRRRERERETLS